MGCKSSFEANFHLLVHFIVHSSIRKGGKKKKVCSSLTQTHEEEG